MDGLIPMDRAHCGLIDVTLALTFSTAELRFLLERGGWEINCDCHVDRGTIAHAHVLVHEDERFARYLEAVLDLVHADALERLEREPDLGRFALFEVEDAWARPGLAGITWAVARLDRPDVAAYRGGFVRRLELDAVRSLAARAAAHQAPVDWHQEPE